MENIFFVSDHHLYHENTFLKFKDNEGQPMRPFHSVSEMHECMVERHNKVVTIHDKVYFMGDVTMRYGWPFANLIGRFNGKKRLLLGNHDRVKGTNLMDFFQKVAIWRVFGEYGFVCSHIPMHPSNFRGQKLNVHGHIHHNDLGDPRYFNVSVERIDYTPVALDVILDKVKDLENRRIVDKRLVAQR